MSTRAFVSRTDCALCATQSRPHQRRLTYSPEDMAGFQTASEKHLASVDFRLLSCARCGFQWTSPQPSDTRLAELYAAASDDYFAPLGECSPARRSLFARVARGLRTSGVTGGRLLDLGCGTGGALAAFRDTFQLFGVEPSPWAARMAGEATGASVHVGDLISAGHPAAHFDAVTAFDVVEHLPDPLRTLREVRRVLRPGGMLVVETGDVGSLNARLAGSHWYYVLLPGHLSFFSRTTIAAALEAAGFSSVTSHRTHHGALTAGYLSGYARAMARHLLLQTFGVRVLSLPVFRTRSTQYRIPYLFDHMLVLARA